MRFIMRVAIDGCLVVMMGFFAIVLHVSLMNICRANLSQATAYQHYGSTDARPGRRNKDRS